MTHATPTDLTRWNRAGRSRFRYIGGNAVTHLEALRLAMRDEFSDAGGALQWTALDTAIPMVPDENPAERQARWLAQYGDERRDYGWEVLRSYARACHVLTEYIDAYANETFLGTATQWDYVRRLVEMLDYHPSPRASAATDIALLAKPGKSGTVETGFAFKNKPEDGSPAAIFETLEDIDVDYTLNALRPLDWNRSQEPFPDLVVGPYSADFPLAEAVEGVSAGSIGVLLIEGVAGVYSGIAVTVKAVVDDSLTLQSHANEIPTGVLRHQVRLLLKPALKQSPRLSGDGVVVLDSDHGLTTVDRVAWDGGASGWLAARVKEVDGDRVLLSGAHSPVVNQLLYRMLNAKAQNVIVKTSWGDYPFNRVVIPLEEQRGTPSVWDVDLGRIDEAAIHEQTILNLGVLSEGLYDYVDPAIASEVYYVLVGDAVASVAEVAPQSLELDGDPGDLATGDWLVVDIGAELQAAEITDLAEGENSYKLTLLPDLTAAETLYGEFELDLRPAEYDLNRTPVIDTGENSDQFSILPLDLSGLSDLLEAGRRAIVADLEQAIAVTVTEVDLAGGSIKVVPPIPVGELSATGAATPFQRHNTLIHANVARAGHGESQQDKILGSGDATRSSQGFDFDVDDVSFVPDPAFSSGVRAAVIVNVDGRTWQQVPSRNDSSPEDPHYTVRVKEDSTLRIEFGNGSSGRRLPSGGNNLRISHRSGAGLSGNLAPYSLVKVIKPHHLIEGIAQPISSTGGNDMEGVESMRDNAAAGVLTLDRAVSLSDFQHMAQRNSGVWQARALRRQPGLSRSDRIEVVLVPAGGGALGTLGTAVENFLSAHALPGVEVSAVLFETIIMDLKLVLRIKEEEYDPDMVSAAVAEAVAAAFSLEHSSLGEPLFRSRVFQVVEAVVGVQNCQCEINPDGFVDEAGNPAEPRHVITGTQGAVRRVSVWDRQVIYFDQSLSTLEISALPYGA